MNRNSNNSSIDPPAYFICDDKIGQIVFNQPDNRNSMMPPMLTAFSKALGKANAGTDLRRLVTTGTGKSLRAG